MALDRRKFIKKISAGVVGAGFITCIPDALFGLPINSGGLPRSTPELQGVSSEAILKFVQAVEKQNLGLHSMMLVRHGQVIAEGWWAPYAPELKHTLYSLSKSFTSTAIGFAVAEGKLKVTDKVVSFFPEEKPAEFSANLAAMRIKDLLTMTAGHEKDSLSPLLEQKAGGWVRTFLSLPVEREPGTYFVYNTGATYMLSAILQKITGQTVLEYLTPRLFRPLQIEGADWENDPEGINVGGFGLRVKTEDIAKFGQLYLQKGMWNGKQLLPAKWVKEATAAQVPTRGTKTTPPQDWDQGYGYQIWRSRHNTYRGDGAMGQYCLVLPEQDAVLAITSETRDMQAILNQVWQILLPALKAKPLPQNPESQEALKNKLASLSLLPPSINNSSPLITAILGKPFRIQENELQVQTVSFTFKKDRCIFRFRENNEPYEIVCGLNDWIKSQTNAPGSPPSFLAFQSESPSTKKKIAAFGTWTSPDIFEITLFFIQTAHSTKITCHFKDNQVQLAFKDSITSKAPERKTDKMVLTGRLAS